MKMSLLSFAAMSLLFSASTVFASGGPAYVDCFAGSGETKIDASFGINGAKDQHTSRAGSILVGTKAPVEAAQIHNEVGTRSASNLNITGPTLRFVTKSVTSNGDNANASIAYHGVLTVGGAKTVNGFNPNGSWPAQCEYTPAQ